MRISWNFWGTKQKVWFCHYWRDIDCIHAVTLFHIDLLLSDATAILTKPFISGWLTNFLVVGSVDQTWHMPQWPAWPKLWAWLVFLELDIVISQLKKSRCLWIMHFKVSQRGLRKHKTNKLGSGNWPGVYECLHGCCKKQDHTGAAERSSTLLLLFHRVAGLKFWIHKPQRESVCLVALHTEEGQD